MPIDDSDEINESPLHSYIRDIRTPYLICMSNFHVTQKVWVFFVCLVRYSGVLVRINGSYSERFHETSHFETSGFESFLPEHDTHPSRSEEWMLGIHFIESFENSLFFWISSRRIVIAGTRYSEKFCLARNREKCEVHIHEREFSFMVTFIQAVSIFF